MRNRHKTQGKTILLQPLCSRVRPGRRPRSRRRPRRQSAGRRAAAAPSALGRRPRRAAPPPSGRERGVLCRPPPGAAAEDHSWSIGILHWGTIGARLSAEARGTPRPPGKAPPTPASPSAGRCCGRQDITDCHQRLLLARRTATAVPTPLPGDGYFGCHCPSQGAAAEEAEVQSTS